MINFLQQRPLLALLFLLAALGYWIVTRFIGLPSLSKKRPGLVWIADIFIAPLFVVIGIFFLIHCAEAVGIMDIMPNAKILKSGLLHFVTFWLIARGLDLFIWRSIVYRRTGYAVPVILRGLGYALILLIGLSVFLWQIDYPLTGFLVSTGLIAGVLGFALQNTINDLFSGIAISLEQPFIVGDWIELEDKSVGQVVDITWRSTRLETLNHTIIAVPNSILAAQNINNLDRPTAVYSKWHMIRLSPEIDPELATTILSSAVIRCRHVLQKPAPLIRLSSAESNPYIYSVWVHYSSYLAHFKGQEELFKQIHTSLNRAGILPVSGFQEVRISRKPPFYPLAPPVADTLRSLEIFHQLTEYEIDQVAALSEYIRIEEDGVIMEENHPTQTVYVLVNGSLETSVLADNGKVVVGQELVAGDSFGWTAVCMGENAIMTVKAKSDSLILAMNGQFLCPVLASHPELLQHFTDLVMRRGKELDQAKAIANKSRRLPRSPGAIRKRIEKFISEHS